MDMEILQKFMQMAQNDANIAKRVQEIGLNNMEGLLAYAKELGLALPDNALEELTELASQFSPQLGDRDLQDVAGGFFKKIDANLLKEIV